MRCAGNRATWIVCGAVCSHVALAQGAYGFTITPSSLQDLPVPTGERLTRTLTISNTGATDQVFRVRTADGDGPGFDEQPPLLNSIGADVLVPGDVDGDKDLDVIGRFRDGTIAWWENGSRPDATWPRRVIAPASPYDLAAADVDGDGDIDVVGGNSWWENSGAWEDAWIEHTLPPALLTNRYVCAVDFDSDGDMDIAGAAEVTAWWEQTPGQGSGWVRHVICPTGSSPLVAADFNNDGHPDLLAKSSTGQNLAWWENSGGPVLAWTEHEISAAFTTMNSLDVADIDGDGDLDICGGGGPDGKRLAWCENTDGHGFSWSNRPVAVFYGPRAVHARDMDSDGDLDIVSLESAYGNLYWFENVGQPDAAWPQHVVDNTLTYGGDAFIADMNGDTVPDAVASGIFAIHLCTRAPDDSDAWLVNTIQDGGRARTLFAADLDRDGDPDVLSSFDHQLVWWENARRCSPAWIEHLVDPRQGGATDLRPVDLDGDGAMDAVGLDPTTWDLAWWQNTVDGHAATWLRHPVAVGTRALTSGDVDGDGDEDLVALATTSGNLVWLENADGLGTAWNEHSLGITGITAACTADLDGDVDMDVVGTRGAPSHGKFWLENVSGHGNPWNEHAIGALPQYANELLACDLDGDGDQDLAVTGAGLGVWLNVDAASGVWTSVQISGGVWSHYAPRVFDPDNDGDADLAFSYDGQGKTLKWAENVNGIATHWTSHVFTAYIGTCPCIDPADFDGDGKDDVAACVSAQLTGISWWKGNAGLPDWLTVQPTAGIVPAGNEASLALTFHAQGLQPGERRQATLAVTANDPPSTANLVEVSMVVVGADLVPSDVRVIRLSGVSVRYRLQNRGTAAAGSSRTAFYLSADDKADANDIQFLQEDSVPALAPGQAVQRVFRLPSTNTAPGVYHILARADADNRICEGLAGETNNVAASRGVVVWSWRVRSGPFIVEDTRADSDGDRFPDVDEYMAGTDPRDSLSYLGLLRFDFDQQRARIQWRGGSETVQYLDYSPDLKDGSWTCIYTCAPSADVTSELTNRASGTRGYYRVRVAP